MWALSIDREKCNGCGICQIACSIAKKNTAQPSEARIRVNRYWGELIQSVVVCQHCAEPVCETACLMKAIDNKSPDGYVSREPEKCFACGACMVMCPIEAPVYDSDSKAVVTCDLCGGDPICVKVCPEQALQYQDTVAYSTAVREKQGLRFYAWQQEEV